MMKYCLLSLSILLCFISCNPKENTANSTSSRTVILEKLDSIKIDYLGRPVVHDLDPVSETIIFMENNADGQGEEIFVADFDGNILASFIKDGDTRDTYGRLMAPLVIDGENSFMAYAYNGFMRYDFDGNLISRVKIDNFQGPGSFIVVGMGSGLQRSGEKFLHKSIDRNFEFEDKDFFANYYAMSLLDPKSGKREPIIPLPESSIFRRGDFFFNDSWDAVFYVENDRIYVVFGLEPTIYIYENRAPHALMSSIPLDLPKYHYFKGAEAYNKNDIRFFGHRKSSGRIFSIKKIADYFLLTYFPGYDAGDTEESLSSKVSQEFWERMREKYPDRIAILDSKGEVVNNFVPTEVWARSMLVRNGELWMMGKSDGEVELDYFQIFKMGLKIGE